MRGRTTDTAGSGGERLQKVLAHAGVASRRACENLMLAGRVSVDGDVCRELGTRVDPHTAVIHVDGKRVLTRDDHVTVVVNKPRGVVSTMSDPQGRPTLGDIAARFGVRLYHVGRLDTDSEGLILLSNDGELTHRLTHPSWEVTKTYVATVDGSFGPGEAKRLRDGVVLEDGHVRADRVRVKDRLGATTLVEISLHSGRNRVVRRMCAEVGHPVKRLVRTRFGALSLAGLKPGQARRLSNEELVDLMSEVGL